MWDGRRGIESCSWNCVWITAGIYSPFGELLEPNWREDLLIGAIAFTVMTILDAAFKRHLLSPINLAQGLLRRVRAYGHVSGRHSSTSTRSMSRVVGETREGRVKEVEGGKKMKGGDRDMAVPVCRVFRRSSVRINDWHYYCKRKKYGPKGAILIVAELICRSDIWGNDSRVTSYKL